MSVEMRAVGRSGEQIWRHGAREREREERGEWGMTPCRGLSPLSSLLSPLASLLSPRASRLSPLSPLSSRNTPASLGTLQRHSRGGREGTTHRNPPARTRLARGSRADRNGCLRCALSCAVAARRALLVACLRGVIARRDCAACLLARRALLAACLLAWACLLACVIGVRRRTLSTDGRSCLPVPPTRRCSATRRCHRVA